MSDYFKAYVVKEDNGVFSGNVEDKSIQDLPANDVLINVKYSSLNFKDALSCTGNRGITKKYPHTPGIDASGIIVNSKKSKFKPGDKVIVTGFDLGMNTSGGFGQYISVPEHWIIKLPDGLTLKESMIIGTAGFTAALAVYKLEEAGLKNKNGELLVTGATGSLGSMSVKILSQAGYKSITAVTGKSDKKNFLKTLGAHNVIDRSEVIDNSGKFMLTGRWDAVIDSVGGNILSTAVKSTKYSGLIASCGLTQSFELHTTVYPFILRSVSLIGVDSAACSMNIRQIIWEKLSNEWKLDNLDTVSEEVSLYELEQKVDLMIKGKNTGRILINLEK